MIPTHVLAALTAGLCVAVLSRDGELYFYLHPATDGAETIRAFAARRGLEVLATHLRDRAAIRALVASRERDVGGEA